MSNPLAIGCLIPYLAARSAVDSLIAHTRADSVDADSAPIARCRATDVDLNDLFAKGQPVIIKGLTDVLRPSLNADLNSLRSAAADSKATFEVKLYDRDNPYFLYTGDYGQTLTSSLEMTLESFLRAMFDEDTFQEHAVYRLFDHRSLDGLAGNIIDALADALAARVSREPERRASGIWIGSRSVVTPLHYDAWPGLLFQTHGSKRVLMFAPDDIHRLYFLPQYAVGDRWSHLPARSSEADPARFPSYSRATRLEATLSKGEALFIPPFWPHEIEALEPNISIPFRFSSDRSDYLHPRFLRPACEVVHSSYIKPLKNRF